MGMVVDDDKATAVSGGPGHEPLSAPSVDGAVVMLCLNYSLHIPILQVTVKKSFDCVDSPGEANDLRVARTSLSA
jgi:hypothetical protein